MAENKDKKINIAALISSMNIGGYEVKLDLLARHLDRERFKLTVILVYPDYKAEARHRDVMEAHRQFFQWDGVETVALPMKGRFDIRLVGQIAQVLKDYSVDVLYFMAMGAGTFLGPLAGRRGGVKRIIRASDTIVKGMYPAPLKMLDRYFLHKVDCVQVPSDFLRRLMMRELKIPEHSFSVVPNGIDLNKFGQITDTASIREELQLSPDSKCVGIIANLNEVKDHRVLISAVPDVLKKCPNTYFLIIGEGPLREPLEQMSSDLGIADNVKFLGFRSDIEKITSLLNIGLSCSKVETLGISLMEMMAAGIPIIAPPVGGIPEFLTDQETGIFVKQGDSKQLSEAIILLLSNTVLAGRYGDNARKLMFSKYSGSNMVAKIEEVFEINE